MWVLLLFAPLAAQGAVLEYSAFSGLTGVFKIGTPAQRVRLGLDFREDEILVLDPPLCPPFVRLCFELDQSSTFERSGVLLDLTAASDEGSVIAARDVVEFKGESRQVPLLVVTERRPQSAHHSEIGGLIGLSPQSTFFSGMRMTFSRSVWRRPQSVSLRAASSGGSSDILLNSTNARQWTFDAALVVNATSTAVSFEIDLSEPDILVPVELRWMFGGAGVVDDRTGRLSVECDVYASLGIQIDNDTVEIHPFALMYANENAFRVHLGSRRFCSTRVRFHSQPSVVLGRPWLASLAEVVLDFQLLQIGVSLIKSDPVAIVTAVHVAKPFVPVFADPVIDVSARYWAITFAITHMQGLVLLNGRAVPLEEGTGWRFARSVFGGASEDVVFPGRVAAVTPQMTENGFQLFAVPARPAARQFKRITVRQREEYVHIIVSTDLPNPGPVAGSVEPVDCGICLESIRPGDASQQMPGCTHEFREYCVERGLESEKVSCPICPSPVEVRNEAPPRRKECCNVS